MQFKNKMFLKASLVRQICQSLAAKSFTSKLKSWMLHWTEGARSPISAAKPHIHTSNRQSLLLFMPFHALSSASLSRGAQMLVHSSKTAQRRRRCHCCDPTASHREGPQTHITPPTSRQKHPSGTLKSAKARGTPGRARIRPSRPGQPRRGCISHRVPGSHCSELLMCLQAETRISSLVPQSLWYPVRRAPKCLFPPSPAGTLTSRCAQLG